MGGILVKEIVFFIQRCLKCFEIQQRSCKYAILESQIQNNSFKAPWVKSAPTGATSQSILKSVGTRLLCHNFLNNLQI